jgi:hypothetical protein
MIEMNCDDDSDGDSYSDDDIDGWTWLPAA